MSPTPSTSEGSDPRVAERHQATAEQVVALLAAAAPGDPDNPANLAVYTQLAPHVLATASLGDHSPAGRRLVVDTIRHLQAHGNSSGSHAARAVADQLLDRCRSLLGLDHPDI